MGGSGRGEADRESFKGREKGWGLDMRFHKILPEAESSFRCTNVVVVESPKSEVRRNVQKFHFLTEGRQENAVFKKKTLHPSAVFRPWIRMLNFHTFHIPEGHLQFLYTSAFWLFSSTFSSSFFSSSDEPFSFSPVFQLPCLCRRNNRDFLLTGYSWGKHYKCTCLVPICIIKLGWVQNKLKTKIKKKILRWTCQPSWNEGNKTCCR